MDDTDGGDPRARWRTLPARVERGTWIEEQDPDPVPAALAQAEADEQSREARYLLERGGGLF